MTTQEIKGIIVPILTPMNEDETVNHEELVRQIERLIGAGVHGIFVFGTNGEGYILSEEEKAAVLKTTVEAVHGRVPVYAGTGCISTRDTIRQSLKAWELGADALSIITPSFAAASQDELVRHYEAVAKAVDLPIILYNIPGRCSVNMTAETTLRIANACDNVIAVKEASGDMDQVKAIVDGAKEGFSVYSGDDSATFDIMKLGGVGVISTIGNVAPARMKEIVDLCAAGEWEKAAEANERLLPLMKGLFATANPILVKEALKLTGFPVGGVRLPLVDATPEQSETLAQIMREVGVL